MRLHLRLLLAAAVAIAVPGCGYIGESPEPTGLGSPTAVAVATDPAPPASTGAPPPSATAPSAATPTPIASTTATPVVTPIATEPPSPSPEPSTGVWERLADFPPDGAKLAAIATYAGGFVALGNVESGRDCEGLDDGRIWTSANGRDWTAANVDLTNVTVTDVVNADGEIYAFGYEGSSQCPPRANLVISSTDGTDWRISDMRVGNEHYFSDFAATGDTLLGFGEAYDKDGESLGSVWTSPDGIEWTVVRDSPETMFVIEGVAAAGDTAVFFDYGPRPARVSTDGGRTWLTADYGPLYAVSSALPAAGNGRFVAVGSACCTTPNEFFGFAIASTDGVNWRESEPFGFRQSPDGVVALPGGFATIGRRSLLSHDGLEWVVAPELPGYESGLDDWPAGAATADTVAVINVRQAWAASVADLDPKNYVETPRPPEMPEIRVRYPASVFTHCGWPDTHFAMRAWVPDPPIDDINPPRGLDELDRGWFTLISENELEYESERGRVITLRPSDEPIVSGPCA